MKLVILAVVLMFGFFVSAELGEDWDSFEGNDSGSSSVGVNVETGGSDVSDFEEDGYLGDDAFEYKTEFYVALGVGGFGILVVAIFVYFFLRKPKNRWAKAKPPR